MNRDTSLFSFFVSGFPDLVSSGGGIGGAGREVEPVACRVNSTSGSRINEEPSRCVSPKLIYGAGKFPGSNLGRGLKRFS